MVLTKKNRRNAVEGRMLCAHDMFISCLSILLPKTFRLIFYQPNYDINLTSGTMNEVSKFFRLYLVALFKYVRWRCRVCMILIMILVHVSVGEGD